MLAGHVLERAERRQAVAAATSSYSAYASSDEFAHGVLRRRVDDRPQERKTSGARR
jgi:hypothetical protein